MDEQLERQILTGEIALLRVALCKARGLPTTMLGSNDDLPALSVDDLRDIEGRLTEICRVQGGLH